MIKYIFGGDTDMKMVTCKHCGNEIPNINQKCNYCGSRNDYIRNVIIRTVICITAIICCAAMLIYGMSVIDTTKDINSVEITTNK